MRYADFLIRTKDYVTLQKVATDLSAAKSNLRVYRYLGMAAYENKDYPTALTALNKWITQADPKRLLPLDYLYRGRTEIALKNDSLGIMDLQKALTLDTTQVDLYGEIAKSLYALQKYKEAGDAYKVYVAGSRKATLGDHFKEGFSYYEAFKSQLIYKQTHPDAKVDSSMLVQADSAFTYVERKAKNPVIQVVYYHAEVKDFEEVGDRQTIKGLAKPYFEQYAQLAEAKGAPTTDGDKSMLADAYIYLGNYAEYKDNDHTKALDYFNKAKELEPTDARVTYYFQTKGAAPKSK
jgi:tetratricopeptide (TPR) repeat protein